MPKRKQTCELEKLSELVDAVRSISGTKAKIEILKTGMPVGHLLQRIYNPTHVFGVTAASIRKALKGGKRTSLYADTDLATLLDALAERTVTGHAALDACCGFIQKNAEYEDLIICALNKDLKMKAGVKVINQAIPNLIACFEVSLGYDIEKHKPFYEKQKEQFWASRKLNGTRCIIKKGTAYSRTGKVYPRHIIEGLDNVVKVFDGLQDWVFDGEMVVIDEDKKEDFPRANSLMTPSAVIHEKKKTKLALLPGQTLQFWCFDIIDCKCFEAGQDPTLWVDRQKRLKEVVPKSDLVHILPQTQDHDALWKTSCENGWEGIYYAYNAAWKSGRSRYWLKKKLFKDHEFTCVKSETGEMAVPGSCEQEEVLARIFIEGEVDGKVIRSKVGSGFSWNQRQEFKDGKLTGTLVKIRYTELSQSSSAEENVYSLQFPRFICSFPNGRD